LSASERLGDALFTGLRLTSGVDLALMQERYGVDIWARYRSDLEPFMHHGCLRRDGDRLRLTRRGMLLANEVMAVFV
jgi:oxygen-independent coproporphyrinogen-3 oxidase